jgi:ribonuclease Z
VAGGSRAGEGTLIVLPQLRLALDPGRPHRALTPMTTVFVSHGHMDHLGGLGYWASQRHLNAMGPAAALAPRQIAPALERLLELSADLEGGRPYDVEVIPVTENDRHRLRGDIEMSFFATDHWVPTLGTRLVWTKRRLRSELAGLPGEEIARRRRAGETVSEEQHIDLVSYCADSGPLVFARHPGVVASEVVFLECSFFRAGDRDRAERYGHLHLEDLLAMTGRLRCRHLVLLHASRRHRLREVEEILDRELRPRLDCELHHLIVDWD